MLLFLWFLQNKGDNQRQRIIRFFSDLTFVLYIGDFFLMPLAYGEIDIEKLPFHVCTAMCVLCFLAYRVACLRKYQLSFVKLGFLSNFIYLLYPAGVMWQAVHPFSYRVVQTLLFHCLMSVYGFLMLVFADENKHRGDDLSVIVAMTVWALVGNYVYNGRYGTRECFFNWFFVVNDPFGLLRADVGPWVMPFVNIILFFMLEIAIDFLFRLIRYKQNCLIGKLK